MIVTRDFEIKLLIHLLRDEKFFKEANYITLEDFDLAPCKLLYETATDYFITFGRLPSLDTLQTHLFFMMAKSNTTAIIPEEHAMLASIFQLLHTTELDLAYYQHQLPEYMKATRNRKILAKHVASLQLNGVADDMLAELSKVNASIKSGADDIEIIDEHPALLLSASDRIIVPTGLRSLDWSLSGGLPLKCLGMITACSGIGKTTSLVNFLVAAVETSRRALYITLEEPADNIKFRYQAIRGVVKAAEWKRQVAEWPAEALWRFSRIQDPTSLGYGYAAIKDSSQSKPNIAQIDDMISRWKEKVEKSGGNPDDCLAVMIDWLDYIQPRPGTYGKTDRTDIILTRATEQLAEIARTQNVAIWTATQGTKSAVRKENLDMADVAHAYHKNDALTVGIGLGVVEGGVPVLYNDDAMTDPPAKRTLRMNLMKNRFNPKTAFNFYQGESLRYFNNTEHERIYNDELEKLYKKLSAAQQ